MMEFSDKWKKIGEEVGSYWKHRGNPKQPHALLTSGNHSDGFFNGSNTIKYPLKVEDAVRDLLSGQSFPLNGLTWVIGSANGATTIPHEMAKRLGLKSGFTEKVLRPVTLPLAIKTLWKCLVATLQGKPYSFEGLSDMALKRFELTKDDWVIVVEDVITTGGTTLKTIAAIEATGARVYKKIYVLMNRSGKTHLGGREIIALIDEDMPIWKPEACLLCKAGSVALRPKGNWDKLNAVY